MQGYRGANENVHGISLQWKGVQTPDHQDFLHAETWKKQSLASIAKSSYACTAAQLPINLATADQLEVIFEACQD